MKFLIIEDEVTASTRLRRMVLALKPEGDCLAELRGVEDALAWIAEHGQDGVDVAFVDIQLSDGLSFELFESIEILFPVIFTTAYDHYALRVFQVHTIDYLLKPIKQDQLRDALGKLEKFGSRVTPRSLREALSEIPSAPRQRFMVRSGRAFRVVPVSEVRYFFSQNKITYLVAADGKRYALDTTLDHLETVLSQRDFKRANRQFIVCIEGIEELVPHTRSRLKIKLHPPARQEVVVSTEKASDFKEWLEGKSP